jgi:pilus assembly protein Flp/PilA
MPVIPSDAHPRKRIKETKYMSHFQVKNVVSALRGEEGQGLAEYALILALIAVVAILALVFLGGQISGILSTIGENI